LDQVTRDLRVIAARGNGKRGAAISVPLKKSLCG
jgi:hypothetical protein